MGSQQLHIVQSWISSCHNRIEPIEDRSRTKMHTVLRLTQYQCNKETCSYMNYSSKSTNSKSGTLWHERKQQWNEMCSKYIPDEHRNGCEKNISRNTKMHTKV